MSAFRLPILETQIPPSLSSIVLSMHSSFNIPDRSLPSLNPRIQLYSGLMEKRKRPCHLLVDGCSIEERVIYWWDMRITEKGRATFEEDGIRIPLRFGKGKETRVHSYNTELGLSEWEHQKNEPIKIEDLSHTDNEECWLFREIVLTIQDCFLESSEEKITHIKHFVYKKTKTFTDICKEVERFERFEKMTPNLRERIPEEVRMFVWRRDDGKCVQCNSNKNLEFDHIIPVAKGGNSTERNIQLLCSECNRKKSDTI
jgi:hypothetical protein